MIMIMMVRLIIISIICFGDIFKNTFFLNLALLSNKTRKVLLGPPNEKMKNSW